MKIGDIVSLKEFHPLKAFITGNCIIDDKTKLYKGTHRYHIKTLSGELKMTWVVQSEVDCVSNIRDNKLKELGI